MHTLWLIAKHIRLNDQLPYVLGATDIPRLMWLGDGPTRIVKFTSNWEHAFNDLDPKARLGESANEELLCEELKQSVVLGADVKHNIRSLPDNAYHYLLDAMARFLDGHRVDMNRSIHALMYQDMARGGKRVWCNERRQTHGLPVLSAQ